MKIKEGTCCIQSRQTWCSSSMISRTRCSPGVAGLAQFFLTRRWKAPLRLAERLSGLLRAKKHRLLGRATLARRSGSSDTSRKTLIGKA